VTPPPTDKIEAETRLEIDAKLESASWVIQDKKAMNLYSGDQGVHGVVVRDTIIEIVEEKLNLISKLETEVEKQFGKAEKNKQSILASAFSGNLLELNP